MHLSNEWFATTYDSNNGTVVLRGRMHLDAVRQSGLYGMRVEIQCNKSNPNIKLQ